MKIAGWLYEDRESFEPWVNRRRTAHRPVTVVDEWCQGYARAMRLRAADWRRFRRNAVNKDLMTPILDSAIAIYVRWRKNATEGEAWLRPR